jgi:hypothetical protein
MKTTSIKIIMLICAATVDHYCVAQGFVNLDFEDATVAPTPINGFGGPVDPAAAFPGWTVGGSGTFVLYNQQTAGSPAVSLMGPDFPNGTGYSPLQGSYSVLIYYDYPSLLPQPTLSQTGTIPSGIQSINFLVGNGSLSDAALAFNGINIPLVSISGGRMAGNISAFAGDVAQITFSTSNNGIGDNFLYFDDIQFSTLSIPEPNSLGLLAWGCSLCGFFYFRRK